MSDLYCSNMACIMLAGEEDAGRKGVWPHHKRLPKWFLPEDWASWPVLSYDARELHIGAISSARSGALRRLIDGAAAAGLLPVIVEPMGAMHAILAKWGWVKSVHGEGWDRREEWRPPASGIAVAQASGTGTGAPEGKSPAHEVGDAQ